MRQSAARYVYRRGSRRTQGAKAKESAHRLAQLRASPWRDPFRVDWASGCRFRVDFVDVLWSISGQRLRYCGVSGGIRTWPPGPELRAKLKSTRFRGTAAFLNACNHSRAPTVSALVSRLDSAGGTGRDRLWAVA